MGEKSKHFQRQDMADLLKNVLEYLKVNKPVTKDNVAFRIVTVGSFGIFMLCSILNGLTSYFGDPIICKDRDSLMEAECTVRTIWTTNTFGTLIVAFLINLNQLPTTMKSNLKSRRYHIINGWSVPWSCQPSYSAYQLGFGQCLKVD